MEQENQTINSTDLGGDRPMQDNVPSQTNNAPDAAAQNFDQLMAASPVLSPLAGWLKCLRKPAISVEYSFKKRHVPDLDRDCPKSGQSGSPNAAVGGQSIPDGQGVQGGQGSPSGACGQNSDVMGAGGSFTIRYFDFALGILGLAIVRCMTRGCRCLARKLD